jgi:hypothetical protein
MGDKSVDTHRMTKIQLQGDIFCTINASHSCQSTSHVTGDYVELNGSAIRDT